MRRISKKSAPVHVIIHAPETEDGKRKLSRQVAVVHADMVNRYIQKLNCPSKQKARLLEAVINALARE